MPLTNDEIAAKFRELTVWKRGGQRAPHKPLLALVAIARLLRGDTGPLPFHEVDPVLRALLEEFGPRRKSQHPECPFWRLQNDGLWEVRSNGPMRWRTGSSDIPRSELLDHEARGAFPDDVRMALQSSPALVDTIVNELLTSHFPETLHADLLAAVGISLGRVGYRKSDRDPDFRPRILRAYEYRCAVCGFDVCLGKEPIALEAAHIRWHQAGGPDEEVNGLALCALHHKLFDRGAFTLTPSMVIQVSEDVHGNAGLDEWLLAYHGQTIRRPLRPSYYPAETHVTWHVREVFRGPGRYVA